MADKTLDQDLTLAFKLGTNAFKAGKKSVPAQDQELAKLIHKHSGPVVKNSPVMQLIQMWSAGWHRANLDASVDEAAVLTEKWPKQRYKTKSGAWAVRSRDGTLKYFDTKEKADKFMAPPATHNIGKKSICPHCHTGPDQKTIKETPIPNTSDEGINKAIRVAAQNIVYDIRQNSDSPQEAIRKAKEISVLGPASWRKVIEIVKSKLGHPAMQEDHTVKEEYKPGDIWPVGAGRYGAKNKNGVIYYFDDENTASKFSKSNIPSKKADIAHQSKVTSLAKQGASSKNYFMSEISLRQIIREEIITFLNEMK